MINNVKLLYPGAAPDLCSPSGYITLLREATRAEGWVRWMCLAIGCTLALLAVWILSHGRLTFAGYIIVSVIAAAATFALLFWNTLRQDIAPYQLSANDLCRYQVCEGHVARFGAWTTFGGARNRYERIYWQLDGARSSRGRTPYVLAIFSAFLDLDDTVYIGVDPSGKLPPIFLGAKKPAPEVLTLTPPASLKEVYSALSRYMPESRRWRGNRMLVPFGGR